MKNWNLKIADQINDVKLTVRFPTPPVIISFEDSLYTPLIKENEKKFR